MNRQEEQISIIDRQDAKMDIIPRKILMFGNKEAVQSAQLLAGSGYSIDAYEGNSSSNSREQQIKNYLCATYKKYDAVIIDWTESDVGALLSQHRFTKPIIGTIYTQGMEVPGAVMNVLLGNGSAYNQTSQSAESTHHQEYKANNPLKATLDDILDNFPE